MGGDELVLDPTSTEVAGGWRVILCLQGCKAKHSQLLSVGVRSEYTPGISQESFTPCLAPNRWLHTVEQDKAVEQPTTTTVKLVSVNPHTNGCNHDK